MSRKIYLCADIDENSFKDFCERLDEYEQESDALVEIELYSPGGIATAAIAFAERMRISTCDIQVTGYGLVGSAAVLVLAAGDIRRLTKNSWVMTHEDSDHLKLSSVSKFEQLAAHLRRMEDQWAKMLEDLTTASLATWAKLHTDRETFLTAEDCIVYGLADKVI